MEILIGLGIAVVLLYYWLIGHWFARVLMFPVLAVGTAFMCAVLFSYITAGPAEATLSIIGAILGAPLAWPLASLPIYYQRR